MDQDTTSRIETKEEVQAYLQNLRYALEHGANLLYQATRRVDERRDEQYTNSYTLSSLFPDENPADVLRRELLTLSVSDYIQTVKDLRFPKKSEMREFGKVYDGTEDVYIKIRVELLDPYGSHTVFVMSFHFAEKNFYPEMFPYK